MSIDRKYLSYTRLGEYDELLKDKMAKDDAATLSSANAHAESLAAGKSDKNHLHDDRYYTESEIDTKLSDINTSINNIKGGTVVVKEAEHATSADSATHATTADSANTAITADTASKLGATTLGSSTKPIYLNNGVATTCSSYAGGTKVTLNGANKGGSSASFYAPTSAGTSGYVLTSAGSGAPTWADAATARTNLSVYSIAEMDNALAGKSASTHNHNSAYDAKGASTQALTEAKSYTDTKTAGMATTAVVDNKISTHNTSNTAHNDIRDLISALSTKVNNFLDVDDATTDELSEVLELINNNKGTLESLTSSKVNVSDIVDNLTTSNSSKVLSAKQGVALKALIDALDAELDGKSNTGHGHAIADVSGLQTALDGKANSSHGTHVTWSTTTPKANGTAAVGSETKVARGDHVHPTDTTRASKTEFDTHVGDTDKHITSDERTNWDNAYTHSQADHAPSNAEKNQNAFSNVKVGSVTVAADSATDTFEIAAGTGITVAGDATNDKVTITNSGVIAVSTGTANGTISVNTNGSTTNVAVKGLGTAAYTNSSAYATADHGHTVDSQLSSSSTNPVQNKVVNTAISTLTSTVSANTNSISAHTTAITNMQNVLNDITEITSEEIRSLFSA